MAIEIAIESTVVVVDQAIDQAKETEFKQP